jgi:glycine oxidase
VVIVGGGVMGMMLARELGQAGVDVKLLDKALCGKEASWAGGGIVSPLYPWRYPDEVTELAKWSQAYYPNLVESLEAESGIDSELSRHGLMMLDTEETEQAIDWAQRHCIQVEKINAQAIASQTANLVNGHQEAIWMPQVASVRNPRLVRALRESIDREIKVEILEQQAWTGFLFSKKEDEKQIVGVTTQQGRIEADKIVVCAGAWSGQMLETMGVHIPIEPVRGQIILYKAAPGMLRTIVMKQGKYLIPRRDGRILAGSTVEYEGFDKSTTLEAKESLETAACALLPALKACPIERHWAGLRPGTNDEVPFIGEVPNVKGLYINAGQFRNGLVLAPASVRLMADMLMATPSFMESTPFAIDKDISNP